jgi:alpha-ketoglutarate-dependent taurine dioxygenase
MVKYKLHDNGWTVLVEDFDFRVATHNDINHIARLLASNTLVVFRKQNLSIDDEVRIAKMFKSPQRFFVEDENSTDRIILRVTAELDDKGLTGIAGHNSEMHWHANDQTTPDRKPLVWLYSVRGSKGSRTTWNNNILSYQDLDEEKKQFLSTLKLSVLQNVSLRDDQEDGTDEVDGYFPDLVMTNIAGKKGLFFPFLQISGFKDLSEEQSQEIIDWLAPYTTQEKYCYHHDWEDGDVVIAEQWLGIHKRWEFEAVDKRLLHRIAFDFPDQDYTS